MSENQKKNDERLRRMGMNLPKKKKHRIRYGSPEPITLNFTDNSTSFNYRLYFSSNEQSDTSSA